MTGPEHNRLPGDGEKPLHTNTEIASLEGDGQLERVVWKTAPGNVLETHAIGHVFLMTGAVPSTHWLKDCIALNDKGFVRTGLDLSAAADAKPADDAPLRRVVAASLLDVAVRHGDAYTAPLAAAKSYADDADGLKPLDAFAEKGVPNPNALCRELLEIVPKLSPPAPGTAITSTGIVDRLSAGAAKLVRIERTDAAGTDRGSVVARVTAAALRNDVGEARRELKALPPADRAAAQGWLDKTDVREAALAASRKFADNSMAALAKAGQ